MTFDREALAWASGLFEGEGCISGYVTKDGGRGIQLSLRMTDEDTVARFREVFGFGRIYQTPAHGSRQKTYNWHVGTFQRTQAVIAMLWPWLCQRRRARAKQVLTGYLRHGGNGEDARLLRSAQIRDAIRVGGRTQRSIARTFGVSEPYVSQLKRIAS